VACAKSSLRGEDYHHIPDKFYLIHTPCPAGKPVNVVTIHILPVLGVMLLKPIMQLQWLRFCRIVEACSVPTRKALSFEPSI